MFNRELEYWDAAKSWGIDPDRWEELTDEARGLIVGHHRAKRTMAEWEAHIAEQRAKREAAAIRAQSKRR